MDVHELIRVFLKEENRKELSLYAYMLMGNKNDALDLLSDLLIEIYENPKNARRHRADSLLQNHAAQ